MSVIIAFQRVKMGKSLPIFIDRQVSSIGIFKGRYVFFIAFIDCVTRLTRLCEILTTNLNIKFSIETNVIDEYTLIENFDFSAVKNSQLLDDCYYYFCAIFQSCLI